MRDFIILTDSCCDLTPELAQELGLSVIPLSLEMSGATYHNYLDGREIGFHDFYERIRAGETATTSAVSVGAFEEAMTKAADEGKDGGRRSVSTFWTACRTGRLLSCALRSFPRRRKRTGRERKTACAFF